MPADVAAHVSCTTYCSLVQSPALMLLHIRVDQVRHAVLVVPSTLVNYITEEAT